MLALTILSVFILLIFLMIFFEYRNEKKYQEKRRTEANRKRTPRNKLKVKKVAPKRKPKPEPEIIPEPTPKPIPEPTPKPEPIPEPTPEVEETPVKEQKELPKANYPKFTHARLVEMGLSDEEAVEFVTELIPQLELQIPLIEEALNTPDYHQMERLTHSIKGSTTNLGTGGISDLLVDCNTYLKSGTDPDIAKAYFEHLVHYTAELKEQYS